ncbi:AsmA-like C-terminal region-containing protein [Devosia rhodophyticola]|uniref:AsmA-like C-terminal region-containing protein n=1 Tax=Devosia rhodophyticola TaxID=3026423 RepID=A0ABY7YVL5_9HYPH|nr:AsmA family protein [Devosia rhodophyticola]WDR05351.1 AsmA-like C-terminal region-containing protein [Devosia rhodophyticola]
MLNRIYIVIGLLAIMALAAAFIAPRFIQWSDYRDRMEILASGVLGTEVSIRGDIEFSLLPQPRLHFADVIVGDLEDPAATVAQVDAEFSLMDFLRDNYRVTKLVLNGPVVDLKVDESGLFGSGFDIKGAAGGGNVDVAEASIVKGSMRLRDERSGELYVAEEIDGVLKLGAIDGPYQFQGNLDYQDQRYNVRLNSSVADGDGNNRVSAFVQTEGGYSLAADGLLKPGIAPRFEGAITYRQKPPATDVADDIRGDLVLESKVNVSTDRVVLIGYTLQPDENRAGTRLTGAASIQLGARRSFDAVISGGVFALPPRDASEDLASLPYDFVRTLSELPPPIIPPMPGRIGVDLAEIGLRSFALRAVRLDAHTDGRAWAIDQFIAKLPGDTDVRASGTLNADEGRPAFSGQMSLSTERLDAVGQMWRKGGEVNPLFGMHAALSGRLMLAGNALGLSEAAFTLGEVSHSIGLRIGFGRERRLDVTGKFGVLSPNDSAALAALLPDLSSSPNFAISFPEGSFGLSSASADLFGLTGTKLVAEGQWSKDRISFNKLVADDLGGVSLDATLFARGTLAAPQIWGSGKVGAQSGSAPGLMALYDRLDIGAGVREKLALSAPAALDFELDQPDGGGSQTLALNGKLDTSTLSLRGQLAGGLLAASNGQIALNGTLESRNPDALTRQLGLGEAALFAPDEGLFVSGRLDGAMAQGFSVRVNASSGEDHLGFTGDIAVQPDDEIDGTGALNGYLSDASGLARIIGAGGLTLPGGSANARVHFEGERVLRLTEIDGQAGGNNFAGNISLTRTGGVGVVSGNLALDQADFAIVVKALSGPASMLKGDGAIWPDGPLDIGEQNRDSRGSIAISAPNLSVAGRDALTDARFNLQWDDSRLRLSRFTANLGGGQISGDVAICCSDKLTNKTLSGRVSLADVQLADVLPPALAEGLSGVVDGGVQFSGTGASLADLARNMTGEGSFSTRTLKVNQFDPQVFPAVASLDNLLEINGVALGQQITEGLNKGAFEAASGDGAFTIAGGVLRLANLSIDGNSGRIAGEVDVALETLGLSGNFVLTPRDFVDVNNLLNQNTARIVAQLDGTMLAPERTLDLDGLIATVQMRANENELARLEKLRAEDAARQKAAAEARNALIAAQRKRQEEEAAAAAAEAEKQRQAEEARQLQQQEQEPQPTPPQEPLDLGLPPPQLTPGNTINRPLFFTPLN